MAGGSSKRSMASSPACGGVEVVGTQIGDDKCAEAGKEGAETSFSQIKRGAGSHSVSPWRTCIYRPANKFQSPLLLFTGRALLRD
jgi:hypothetical protein